MRVTRVVREENVMIKNKADALVVIGEQKEHIERLETRLGRFTEALNLIAENGENQDAWDFDNYWYSEYAHATAETALDGKP